MHVPFRALAAGGLLDPPGPLSTTSTAAFWAFSIATTAMVVASVVVVQNCFIYALMAASILVAAPHLRGWRYLAFIPVIPGLYLGGAALCTWPAYLALHAGWPTPVFLALAVLSAAMNVYLPLSALTIGRHDNDWRRGEATSAEIPEPASV